MAPVVAQLRTLRSLAPAAVAICLWVRPRRDRARTMSFAATARRRSVKGFESCADRACAIRVAYFVSAIVAGSGVVVNRAVPALGAVCVPERMYRLDWICADWTEYVRGVGGGGG